MVTLHISAAHLVNMRINVKPLISQGTIISGIKELYKIASWSPCLPVSSAKPLNKLGEKVRHTSIYFIII